MKEKRNLHRYHTQYKVQSHSSMKLVSPLSYINESKNYIKGKIKTYTKNYEKLAKESISAWSSSFTFNVAGIYRRNTYGRGV